ncbi:MAG: TrmB family transcriptional regulator [Candidatus Woesearchaeota archaeon]
MIVSKELLSKLKDFDLNSYEVKLWVALLSRGVATAGELSDIANVPRSRTYDVLESLEKKGFIIVKIGKPIKYLAIEPDKVIEVMKKSILRDANDRTQIVEKLKKSSVLEELQLLHTQGIEHVDSADLTGSIKGKQHIYTHLEATILDAEKEVCILTTTQGFMHKIETLKPVLEKVAKRGVKIKIATQVTDECKSHIENLKDVAVVKHTDIIGRFIVVDQQQIIFMMMDDAQVHPTYDTGIWINTPFFAKTMQDLFDLAWLEMKVVAK